VHPLNILVTGASGLLGSRILRGFPPDWQMTGTCRTNPAPGLIACDLTLPRTAERLLADGGYDWVIHCAANRSPDACEVDPRSAVALNSLSVEWLAQAADNAGARLLYASTDFVFSGEHPPYREGDSPAPVNAYGHSKLAGERAALSVSGAVVVRMPALYSTDLAAPGNCLTALATALDEGRPFAADDVAPRYYTLAEDIAAAMAFLIARSYIGLVHVSSTEVDTKRGFLQAAANALGGDCDLVVPAQEAPPARRPHDTHLDTSLYESLGGPQPRGHTAALVALGVSP
jgi:dTDP-4-dehydrorhamnose reductase